MVKLGNYDDESIWAHNYCIIFYMISTQSKNNIHISNVLKDKFKFKTTPRSSITEICELCKNNKMIESLIKCNEKDCSCYFHISCALKAQLMLPLNFLIFYFNQNEYNLGELTPVDINNTNLVYYTNIKQIKNISLCCNKHNLNMIKEYLNCKLLTLII